MNTPLSLRPHTLALALAASGLLTACPDGGGEDTTPPVTPVTGITLAGVVAKGAALANASVVITCATGSGTATTVANGSYSATIAGGALPCVLKATSSDSVTKLHSVAPASTSSSVTANITPLTELVVAQLTGKEPAAYVAAIVPSTLATTASAVAVLTAQTAVASTLTAGGLNTSSTGDYISGTLVAANSNTAGDAYDQALDALNAKLVAAGTTLAALTTTIAAGSPAAPAPTTSTADSVTLPADLLLKPKAANCASLASGSYWLIRLAPSPGNAVTAVDSFDLDAPTLTFKNTANAADTFQLAANGNCRYTVPGDPTDDIVVAPSGLGVAAITVGLDDDSVAVAVRGKRLMLLLLPKQTIAVADLAGNWNSVAWQLDSGVGPFQAHGYTATIASSGAVTEVRCDGMPFSTPENGCTPANPQSALSVNSQGGFNLSSTNPTNPSNQWTDRTFAYRAGNGELMAISLAPDGSFSFSTKVRTLTLPDVGAGAVNWSVGVRVTGQAVDPLHYHTHTVASLNSTAGTLVRNTANDGSTVTVPQTLEYNKGRNGYLHRLPATTAASDGSAATVRELWALPLRGFGVTPYYVPATSGTGTSANAVLGLSVTKQP